MLRIRIELVPLGCEDKARTIGEMVIANDCSGDLKYGNYEAWFTMNENSKPKYSKVTKFHRLRSAWDLIGLVIKESKNNHVPPEGDLSLSYRLKRRLKNE